MSIHDTQDHMASGNEPDDAIEAYFQIVDRILVDAAPEGYDASLDANEWRLLHDARRRGLPAEDVGRQIATLREWMDHRDASEVVRDPNSLLQIALRMSLEVVAVRKEIATVKAGFAGQFDRTNNYVQGLPNRDDFDALHADVETLRGMIRAAGVKAA